MKKLLYSLRAILIIVGLCFSNYALTEISYFSVVENGAIMYDAPSLKAGKQYVVSLYYPVEIIVDVENWAKVRDSSGVLAWMEKKALSDKRYVVVTAPIASVQQAPDTNSALLFQVEQNVVMEWVDADNPGWIKIRHLDGQTGYVKIIQVWGS